MISAQQHRLRKSPWEKDIWHSTIQGNEKRTALLIIFEPNLVQVQPFEQSFFHHCSPFKLGKLPSAAIVFTRHSVGGKRRRSVIWGKVYLNLIYDVLGLTDGKVHCFSSQNEKVDY